MSKSQIVETVMRRIVVLVFLLPILSIWSGCTVIGLGVGSAIDSSSPRVEQIESDLRRKIQEGKFITVTLANDSVIEGVAGGLVTQSDSLYLANFSGNRLVSDNSPQPGAEITVASDLTKSSTGIFRGYDLGENWSNPVPGQVTYGEAGSILTVIDESLGRKATEIYLGRTRSMTGPTGNAYDLGAIRRQAANSDLPLLSVLCVESEGEQRYLQLNSIVGVKQATARNTKWKLMGIGLAVDLGLLITLLTMDFEYK